MTKMPPKITAVEKKYENWRAEVYDKYNSIKKTDLIRTMNTFKGILKRKKYSRASDCRRNIECETMWSRQGYILRHIRFAILRHDWNTLRRLIIILSSNENFHCYVREITFQLALMAGVYDRRILDEIKLCFTTGCKTRSGSKNHYDIWYVEEV